MKHLIVAALVISATTQAASAASYDWTGFYAGFNLGVDPASSTFTDRVAGDGLAWLIEGDTFTATRVGPTVGLQAGYNIQRSNLVVGVEGDVGYLGGTGRGESQSRLPAPDGTGIYGYIQDGPYASLRARAGIAADRVLVFATVGGIVATHRAYMHDSVVGPMTSESGLALGWTAGGGIEYALADSWTVKLDALYYSLPDQTVRGSDPATAPLYKIASNGGLVRLGFNHKL